MLKDESVVNVGSLSKDGIQTDIREYLQFSFGEETMSTFSRLVDNNLELDSRKRETRDDTKSRFAACGGKASMAQFLRSDAEGYKLLAEEIEKVAKPFLNYFNGESIPLTGRYISDVFLYRGQRKLIKIVEQLCKYGESRRNGMFGYSVEDDHIHIIHDCSYSTRSCRCAFKEKIQSFGEFRPNRWYNKPLWKFTRTDWYDVIVYFFFAKRGARKVWIRGKSWEVPNDGMYI